MKKQNKLRYLLLLTLFIMITISAPVAVSAEAEYADGEYALPFTILKATSDEISTASDYAVNPAKLIVGNKKFTVVMTLKNSSWWQFFKIQSTESDVFTDVTLVSENAEADTRVVTFEINSLEKLLNAQIHVIVTGIPGFEYDSVFDIRFKFDPSNISVVAENSREQSTVQDPIDTPDTKPEPENQNAVTEIEKADNEKITGTDVEIDDEITEESALDRDGDVEVISDETMNDQPEALTGEADVSTNAEVKSVDDKTSPVTMIVLIISVLIIGGLIYIMLRLRSQKQA